MNPELALLPPGSKIEIVAPAGKPKPGAESSEVLPNLIKSCEALGWQVKVDPDMLGDDLLCANHEQARLTKLIAAFQREDTQAIWPLRGGYGCTPLLPALWDLPKPKHPKWLLGFSDITALHILVQQRWQWRSLHSCSATQFALQRVGASTRHGLQALLQGTNYYRLKLQPMNPIARQIRLLEAPTIGGTLTIVQTSLGTPWQLDASHKILLLEEINEAAYRIDRMLNQLLQAGIFKQIKALLLADYLIKGNADPDIESILTQWSKKLDIPVLRLAQVGHGEENLAVPFGCCTQLQLGDNAELIWRPGQESNLRPAP